MHSKAEIEYIQRVMFECDIARSLDRFLHDYLVNFEDIGKFSPERFSEFKKECTLGGQDISMAMDGIYHCGTDKQGRKYFVDSKSGLILTQEGSKFSVAKHSCTSKHYDIFDAAYFREYISHPEIRNQRFVIMGDGIGEITTLDYLGLQIEDIFSEPILEYTVSTKNELNELVSELTSVLSESKFFRKIWFRGQQREYISNTSIDVINRIGFPVEFARMPSLIPSAGRFSDLDTYNDIRIMSMYWNSAFKVWLLSQSKGVAQQFQIDGEMYMEMIRSLEPDKMIRFLRENPYDIDEYVYEQDTEPMRASVLAAQQYGGRASVLDITDDIEVALFFTQSYLNTQTGKYELCQPDSSNVIYIFAGPRNTCTVDISKNLFDSISYDGPFSIPPRILNQHCGLLFGADMFSRNTYAYRILAKIKFSGTDIATTKKVGEMFPSVDTDTLYRTYSYAEPKLTGLYG